MTTTETVTTIATVSTPAIFVRTTEYEGEEFAVMKPTVEDLGLAWSVQARKLAASKTLEVCHIKVIAGDMKSRVMLCIPLRKLPAWICGLDTSRMDAVLRHRIIELQGQCHAREASDRHEPRRTHSPFISSCAAPRPSH